MKGTCNIVLTVSMTTDTGIYIPTDTPYTADDVDDTSIELVIGSLIAEFVREKLEGLGVNIKYTAIHDSYTIYN